MISLVVGICIIAAILLFIYVIRAKNMFSLTGVGSRSIEIEQTPVDVDVNKPNPIPKDDIVLATIVSPKHGGVVDRVLMWNAPPGSYQYVITDDDREIAKGSITSSSGLYMARGLNLIDHKRYMVMVGGTKVDVPYSPPNFDLGSLTIEPKTIRCSCDVVPTSIELVVGGIKLPISRCQMTIEPPGFICNFTDADAISVDGVESHIVVYNGANACSILVL